MANAGVETGANMLGVCTGPPSPKAPGAPRAMEASPLSPTIVATRIAHTTALNLWHGGRSTNRHRAFSTDFVAWLTLPSSRPVLPLTPDHVRWLLARCGPRQHEFGPELAPRRVHPPRPRATPWRRHAPRLRAAASNDGLTTGCRCAGQCIRRHRATAARAAPCLGCHQTAAWPPLPLSSCLPLFRCSKSNRGTRRLQ